MYMLVKMLLRLSQVQNLSQQNAERGEAAGLARAEVEALSSEVSRLREALGRAEAARGAVEREAVHARVAAEEARAKAAAAEADAAAAHESAAVERENARNANYLLQSVKEKERDAAAEAQVSTGALTINSQDGSRIINIEPENIN